MYKKKSVLKVKKRNGQAIENIFTKYKVSQGWQLSYYYDPIFEYL